MVLLIGNRSPMARKKKQTTPLPQPTISTALDAQDLQSLRKSSTLHPSTIDEEDEMVTPPPHLVHPSAGQLRRGDVRAIGELNRTTMSDLQTKTNGTVPRVSSSTVPLISPVPPPPSVVVPPPVSASQGGEAQKDEWAGLFKGKLTAKGTSLSFVAPCVKDGKLVAQLQASELQAGNQKLANANIFYVVGYSPTIAAVYRFVEQQWSNIAKPVVYWHEDGYFIINFQSADDMHTVLYSGPHMFYGKPAIVKPWSDKFPCLNP